MRERKMSVNPKLISRLRAATEEVRGRLWEWEQTAFFRRLYRQRAAERPDRFPLSEEEIARRFPYSKLSLMPASVFRLYLAGLAMLLAGAGCWLISLWMAVRAHSASAHEITIRRFGWPLLAAAAGKLLLYGAGRIIRSGKLKPYQQAGADLRNEVGSNHVTR